MEPSYRQHQELIAVVRELADLLYRQSRQLTRAARKRSTGDQLPGDSALRDTWSHLGAAFQLLTAHAQSVQRELDHFGIKHGNKNA